MPELAAPNPAGRNQKRRERKRRVALLTALASRQHGAVAHRQLLGLGISGSQIERWLSAGLLHRVHRGVYAVGHPGLSRQGQLLAAVLSLGPGAVLSHLSAASVHGLLERDPVVIDVTAPRSRKPRRNERIRLHIPTLQPDRDERTTTDGIPVTTPERTFLDLASMIGERQLTAALRAGQRKGLLEPLAMLPSLTPHRGRHGISLARKVLRRYVPAPGALRSGLEQEYWEICAAHGPPLPLVNVMIREYEADFVWPDLNLIIETDGGEWHSTDVDVAEDAKRDAVHRDLGYEVVRVPDNAVEDRAAALAAHAALLRRAASPAG